MREINDSHSQCEACLSKTLEARSLRPSSQVTEFPSKVRAV